MNKYLVTYIGGGMPHDPEVMAQAKAAFGAWLGEAGDSVLDAGAPLHTVAMVAADEPATEAAVNGFSIVQAESVEAVKTLLSTHPFVGRGGTLQVSEYIQI